MVIALSGCALLLASCGGTGNANEGATTPDAAVGASTLRACALTHKVGVDDLAVQDISCTEARRLANSAGAPGRSDLLDAGFTCTKTGEGAAIRPGDVSARMRRSRTVTTRTSDATQAG